MIQITVTPDSDQDDCLAAAAEAYAAKHPGFAHWDLNPRWESEDERNSIVLSIPVDKLYDAETNEPVTAVDLGVTNEAYLDAMRESVTHGGHEGVAECGGRRVYAY